MLKRVIQVVAATAILSCGAAFAFSFAPVMAVQTMVIHASGAVTSQHASGAVTSQHTSGAVSPPPATPPAPTTPPAPSMPSTTPLSLPGLVSPSNSNNTGGAAPSAVAPVTGGGITPSRGQGQRSDKSAFIDETPGRKVTVALLDGGKISAERMRLGLHDALTVKNGKTVVAVALTRIAGMEFGEKELGRLAVTVNMVDGSVLKGIVYPGIVFEFEGKGRVTATRAEEIATIRFSAE